jgi:hypothetical protein
MNPNNFHRRNTDQRRRQVANTRKIHANRIEKSRIQQIQGWKQPNTAISSGTKANSLLRWWIHNREPPTHHRSSKSVLKRNKKHQRNDYVYLLYEM